MKAAVSPADQGVFLLVLAELNGGSLAQISNASSEKFVTSVLSRLRNSDEIRLCACLPYGVMRSQFRFSGYLRSYFHLKSQ